MIAILKYVLALLFCAHVMISPTTAEERAEPWTAEQNTQIENGLKAHAAGDYARAKTLVLPLAQTGHPKAMNIIGYMQDHGNAFAADPVEGCLWYELSAKAGYNTAMFNLSTCYDQGTLVATSSNESLHWLTMAALNEHIGAMLRLAKLQPEERRHWLNKAAKQGSTVAKAYLRDAGYEEDAPEYGLMDDLCLFVRIFILEQDITACDE